jgi:predicted RNA-binding protein with EMAP domain
MDGNLDGVTGKLWMCKREHGHALGLVVTVTEHGRQVGKLMLFRQAVTVGEGAKHAMMTLPPTPVIGLLEGTMKNVECSVCQSKRSWYVSAEAVGVLLAPLYGEKG